MEDNTNRARVSPESRTAQVCAALNGAGARYLVIGGVACILHGYVRATKDVDILIERTLDNARRVLEGLEGVGYWFARDWTAEEVLRKPITVIGDDPRVDLFTVAWSVKYDDAIVRSTQVHAEGVTIPLIGLEDLIATKRTGRLQDAADIEVLEQIQRLRMENQ
jgi:predicted nucleotidyltransferase